MPPPSPFLLATINSGDPNDVQTQSAFIDFLNYHSMLFHYDTLRGTVVDTPSFRRMGVPVSDELVEMTNIGGRGYCDATFPFSSKPSKLVTPAFINKVVGSFSNYVRKYKPLWDVPGDSAFKTLHRVAYCQFLVQHCDGVYSESESRTRRRHIVRLMLEILAIDTFVTTNHPESTHAKLLFWVVSFLYSTIDRKWDRHRDHAAWLVVFTSFDFFFLMICSTYRVNGLAPYEEAHLVKRRDIHALAEACLRRTSRFGVCLARLAKRLEDTVDEEESEAINAQIARLHEVGSV